MCWRMAASVSVTVVYGGGHMCWRGSVSVTVVYGGGHVVGVCTACRWSLTKSVATLSPKCSGLP